MENFYSLMLSPGSAEVPLPKLNNNKNIIISYFLFFVVFQVDLSVKLFSYFNGLASLCSWAKQWSMMKQIKIVSESVGKREER